MRLYRITCSVYGIRRMAKQGRRDLCGLTTFAFTNKCEALSDYTALKQELKGCDYRMRLEIVDVPERLTTKDWIEFLQEETLSAVQVAGLLRTDRNRVPA